MNPSRRLLCHAVLVISVSPILSACGGGGGEESTWDEFRPRPATEADIQSQAFLFTGFQYGAVFDPSLGTSDTTLSFGAAQPGGPGGSVLPFSLGALGAVSSGLASYADGTLVLNFTQTSPLLPFATGAVLRFALSADIDDGRIRLTNLQTGVEQTSAPR